MNKNITITKRNLVDRLFAVLKRDYNECTVYMPGIETIIPGAHGIEFKRLESFNFHTSTSSFRYKLNVIAIGVNTWEYETNIGKFESLEPDTRKRLVDFINARCDMIPAVSNGLNVVPFGKSNYYTL